MLPTERATACNGTCQDLDPAFERLALPTTFASTRESSVRSRDASATGPLADEPREDPAW